jgi:hypothetical protein
MEPKFKQNDIVKHPSIKAAMRVLGYKETQAGDVLNTVLGIKKYPEGRTMTSLVLCEWCEKDKRRTRYFEEADLQLMPAG